MGGETPRFAATPGTPMARAVDYSFGHSVAQAFPIATVRDPSESEILFDVTPFLALRLGRRGR